MSELRTPEVEDLADRFLKNPGQGRHLPAVTRICSPSARSAKPRSASPSARQLDACDSDRLPSRRPRGRSAATIARVVEMPKLRRRRLHHGAQHPGRRSQREVSPAAVGRGRRLSDAPDAGRRGIRRLPWCSLRRACRFCPLRRTLCRDPLQRARQRTPDSVPVQKSVDTAAPKPAIPLRGRRAFRFGESCQPFATCNPLPTHNP